MSYMYIVNENIERVTKGKYKSYDEYKTRMERRCMAFDVVAFLCGAIVMLALFLNNISYFGEFLYGAAFSIITGILITIFGIRTVREWSENMDESIIHQECCVDDDVLVDIYQTIEYYVGKVPHTYTPTIDQMYNLNKYYMRLTNIRELGMPTVLIDR